MYDLQREIWEGWRRVRARVVGDPEELSRRLARGWSVSLGKTPRAWCLAIRASDHRIPKGLVEDEASRAGAQRVFINAPLLRGICAPVYLTPPGETAQAVARKLGVLPMKLRCARLNGVLRAHYVPGMVGCAGRGGPPAALLYTDQPLDPCARLFRCADPVWAWTAKYLTARLADDFQETLVRVGLVHDRNDSLEGRSDEAIHSTGSGQAERGRGKRLPKPEPDYVWYKWKDGEYLGYDWRNPYAKARYEGHEQLKAKKREYNRTHRPASRAKGSLRFGGYLWVCPMCGRTARTLYLPLPPLKALVDDPVVARQRQMLEEHGGLRREVRRTFGCASCHRVRFFSRLNPAFWNEVVAHLTGGLLYGREVACPAWVSGERTKAYRPQRNPRRARKRMAVLELLFEGLTRREIADRMGMPRGNVDNHLRMAYRKHNVHSREQLARRLGRAAPKQWTGKKEGVLQEQMSSVR